MPGIILASERLKEKIYQALKGTVSCVYSHKCILHNPNTEYKFEIVHVTGISITQDFAGDYADSVQLNFNFTSINDYMEYQKNIQGMECSITLYSMDSKNHIEMPNPPLIYQAKVFTDASTQVDPEKQVNINQFGNSDTSSGKVEAENPTQVAVTIPVSVHLIEADVYNLRQCKFDAMFKDQELESLLHWLVERCGAEKAIIIPPDNKRKYNNIMLTDMDNVGGLLPKLQERNGIYSKGLGFYYTQKTFYVYPLFDVAQETSPAEEVVHLINAPSNYFLGLETYHTLVENDVYIASIKDPELTPLGTEGTMNDGNVAVSVNADSVKDNFAKTGTDGKMMRNNNDITVVSKQNTASDMAANTQNINYENVTSNVYSATSQLASKDAVKMVADWQKSQPRLLKPGQTVFYHYDAAGGLYKTRKGRLQNISYTATPEDSMVEKKWLSFSTSMTIWLEPDQQDKESTQQLQQ